MLMVELFVLIHNFIDCEVLENDIKFCVWQGMEAVKMSDNIENKKEKQLWARKSFVCILNNKTLNSILNRIRNGKGKSFSVLLWVITNVVFKSFF